MEDTNIMLSADTADAYAVSDDESAVEAQAQDDAAHNGEYGYEEKAGQTAAAKQPEMLEQISGLEEGEKRKLFEQLMKSDPILKQEFRKNASNAVKERINKLNARHEKELLRYSGLQNTLAGIYGTEDPAELERLIGEDGERIERRALDAEATADELDTKNGMKLKTNNFELSEESSRETELFREKTAEWEKECEEAKKEYPEISFEEEILNEQTGEQLFNMLESGIPFKNAYEAVHITELIEAKTQSAADKAAKDAIERIKAQGLRPDENANRQQSPTDSKIDIGKLSNEQMEELIKRASRGERITF